MEFPMTNWNDKKTEAALRDLEERTLEAVAGDVAKMIYLASTRDYNTGSYHHAGLAWRYSPEAAQRALARSHLTVFEGLIYGSLERLVTELERYLNSLGGQRASVLAGWNKLQAYRVLEPLDSDPLCAELFASKVKVALAILEKQTALRASSAGLQSPSLAQ
jgi:hypothetical protein